MVKNSAGSLPEAAEFAVKRYGASLSGEHGDGQARGDLLRVMFGDEVLQAFRESNWLGTTSGR